MAIGIKKKDRIFLGDQQHGSGENVVRYGLPHHAVNMSHQSVSVVFCCPAFGFRCQVSGLSISDFGFKNKKTEDTGFRD
jgi:hypothetical protein